MQAPLFPGVELLDISNNGTVQCTTIMLNCENWNS